LAVLIALGGVFLAFFLAFLLFFNAFRKVDEEMNRIIRKAFIAGGVAMIAFGVFLGVVVSN
jgi:cytochrome c biogenesis protein CcdA